MTSASDNRINLLPEHIIDQIKAGEVVEKPAALLKELIENSIDAGSSRIKIHIKNNGLDLISVEDDGTGMSFNELPFAFCRHATSKINRYDDLYALASYGFRGEALASISSVSKVVCTSQPSQTDLPGGKIEIEGGQTISHSSYSGASKGTSLFIKDLFFNTPARLKFIRSSTSERNALKRMINSFLLTNPQITFIIKWDDADAKIYNKASQGKIKRVQDILLKKTDSQDLLVQQIVEYDGHQLEFFCKTQGAKGGQGRKQFLFANNRWFFDKQIHQIILRNMATIWGIGCTGDYVAFIDVPKDKIDVNVHPNKTQLKFLKTQLVNSLVSSAVKEICNKQAHSDPSENFEREIPSLMDQRFEANTHDLEDNVKTWKPELSSNLVIKEKKQFIKISEKYSIIDFNGPHAVNTSSLFACFKSKIFAKTSAQLNDDDILPLLIGEKIGVASNNIDADELDYYRKRGFDIECLDGDLILKSIPTSIKDLPVHDIVVPYLSSLLVYGNESQTQVLNQESVESLISYLGLDSLIEKNIIKPVHSEMIDNLFL